MAASPRPTRWPLLAGGAALSLTVLCALLLHGPTNEGPSSPARQRPAAAAPTAGPAGASPVSRILARALGEDVGDEDAEERAASRREAYTAAFNRKIDRTRQRLAQDCAGDDFLAHALDDFDEVRDRIVDSAIATDQGLKTRAEQREYELQQLLEFDTRLCREVEHRSPGEACMRHFRKCEHILDGRQVMGAH